MNAEQFLAALVPQGDGCLVWPHGGDSDGYGMLRWRGKVWRAHRLAWFLRHGSLPSWDDRLVLDHARSLGCAPDRRCANPDHLRVATVFQNTESGMTGRMWREYREERDRLEDLYLDQAHGYAKDLQLLRERGIVPPVLSAKDWMRQWWDARTEEAL